MFTSLLQSLGSYLDFSKRLATTVPGLVMALALVILTASMPDWARKPFACGEIQGSEAEWNAAERVLQGSGDSYDLRELRTRESVLRRAFLTALQKASRSPDEAEKAKDSLDGQEERSRHEQGRSPDEAEKAKDKLQELNTFMQGDGLILTESRCNYTLEQRAAKEQMFAVDEMLAKNESVTLCNTPVRWEKAGTDLLLFGLLGFILGVIFDPVNKAIFVQLLPEAAAQEENPSGDGQVLQSQVTTQKISSGEGWVEVIINKHRLRSAIQTSVSAIERFARLFSFTRLARVLAPVEFAQKRNPGLLDSHSPQFFIGRGLIAAGEYQDLIDRSYRFSELTTGLVLPVALIGAGLFFRYRATGEVWQGVAWLALCWIGSVLLARVGVRRYAEFRFAVAELIGGRLEALNDQKSRELPAVDLAQLQLLVYDAGRILNRSRREDERE